MQSQQSPTNSRAYWPEGWTQEDGNRLTLLLGQAYAVQRTYGKTAADLQFAAGSFALILRDFPPSQVCQAFAELLLAMTDVPTPADVVRQMTGGVVLDAALYARLIKKRKDEYYVNADEAHYIREYEKARLGGR